MDPYVGEIRLFGFNYPTTGWALCNGQLLAVQNYSALFALLGNQYGGDGVTTFALPNYCGRAPVSQGTGPGLPAMVMGEAVGTEEVTLTLLDIPSHTHSVHAYVQGTDRFSAPAAGYALGSPSHAASFLTPAAGLATLSPQTLAPTGSTLPHENRQPYLVLNYCMALEGVYPSFS